MYTTSHPKPMQPLQTHYIFFFLDPVCLLLSSMAVLCHVIGWLQRALQGKAWSTLQII